jgi:hypothetical protein
VGYEPQSVADDVGTLFVSLAGNPIPLRERRP